MSKKEVQKYSLKAELTKKDEELMNDPSLYGMSGLTFPRYINSMRAVMFCSHLRQFLVPVSAEPPLVFTSSENLVGKHSDGYKRVENDTKVVRKVVKFEDLLDSPRRYKLFVYDTKRNRYDVIDRCDVVDLTENFGYLMNNQTIDGYDEGDTIPAGTVLSASTSYDEKMNYGFGINATTMYTLDPYTSEDAAVVSESFANKFKTIETESFMIKLNDNDYLLNLYGKDGEYKPLPDIGEFAEGILTAIRTQFNSQLLFDFNAKSLGEIHESDRTVYIPGGRVEIIDYTILTNAEESVDTPFNGQINKYLVSQTKYWTEIRDICKTMIESGTECSKEINYLYDRSMQFLDKNRKWKEGDSAFSDTTILISYRKIKPLSIGQKITGRYGNKSVISQIRKDEDMPYTEDGRRVDLLLNLLAIINRTTSFAIYELIITSICDQFRYRMRQSESYEEKEKLMFSIIRDFSERQYHYMKKRYDTYTEKEKRQCIDETIDGGIFIHQSPVKEDIPIFYRIQNILKKYDWLKPSPIYIKQDGKIVKTMSLHWIGEMYIMKLKQSGRRGFSARGPGAIDHKGLPVRSYKSRHHMEKYSDTAIRFGEYETLNFSIGMPGTDIALFHAFYRTSISARADLIKLFLNPNKDRGVLNIDKFYTSRVAEIFNVMLKSLGGEIRFIDRDTVIKGYDNTTLRMHTLNGKSMLCTDYEFFLRERYETVKEEVLSENLILTTDQLESEIQKRLKDKKYLIGPYHDDAGEEKT